MFEGLFGAFCRLGLAFADRDGGFKATDSKTRRKVLTFWTNFEPNGKFCAQMCINTTFLCMRDALVKGF